MRSRARRGDARARRSRGTVTRGGVPAAGRARPRARSTGMSYLTRAMTDCRRHVHAARARGARASTSMRSSAATRSAPPRSAAARPRRSICRRPARSTSSRPRTAAPVPVRVQVVPGAGQTSRRCRRRTASPRIAGGRLARRVRGDRRRHGRCAAGPVGRDRVARLRVRARAQDRRPSSRTRRREVDRDRSITTSTRRTSSAATSTSTRGAATTRAIRRSTKVAQAVADGVELPVRSDHEWVRDFSQEIATLGVQAFAYRASRRSS